MNFLDAVIAVPLIYGAWQGFRKGLIYEIAMLIGLILGIYLGFKFSGVLFEMLQKVLPDQGHLLHYISFFIVAGIILVIFIFYAKLLETVLKINSLNLFNKVAGGAFGLFKLALALSVIFWLLLPFEKTISLIPEKSRKESLLYQPVLNTASWLAPAVKDLKDEFRENFGSK
jgi:membrane protein required for colicin V production